MHWHRLGSRANCQCAQLLTCPDSCFSRRLSSPCTPRRGPSSCAHVPITPSLPDPGVSQIPHFVLRAIPLSVSRALVFVPSRCVHAVLTLNVVPPAGLHNGSVDGRTITHGCSCSRDGQ
eukprot:400769-Rhodomonas_salina.1